MFSQITKYALRLMTVVAQLPPGQRLRAAELARATDVPPAYAAKVLRQLSRAGLLESQKGHQGGYRLARPREMIRLADIIEAVEGKAGAGVCVFGWDRCDDNDPCPLHPVWSSLHCAVADWAESRTLADVSPQDPTISAKR